MEILKCKNCRYANSVLIQIMIPADQMDLIICENINGDHYQHILTNDHICDDKIKTTRLN